MTALDLGRNFDRMIQTVGELPANEAGEAWEAVVDLRASVYEASALYRAVLADHMIDHEGAAKFCTRESCRIASGGER